MKKWFSLLLAAIMVMALAIPVSAEPAQRISLGTGVLLEQGSSQSLNVRYTPSGADRESISWTSSNALVANVTDSGVVTGITPGTATVMARTASGLSASVKVTVRQKDAVYTNLKSIRVGPSSFSMTIGTGRQLTVTYTPSSADRKDLTWRSSDTSVATVDDSGYVTAVGRGTAVISVKTENGDLRSSAQVTVRKVGQKVNASEIETGLDSVRMRVDQTRTLTIYFDPIDVTDKDVVWTSSNTDVATVNVEGEVTGVAPGTAVITATSANGLTSKVTVTVSDTLLGSNTKTTSVNQAQNSSESLTSAAARTAVREVAGSTKKGAVGVAVFKNKTEVTPTVIGAAAYSAAEAERDIQMRFRTETEEGKLQGYITLDPQKAKDAKKTIGVAVYNNSKRVLAAQELAAEKYNKTVAAVQLDHSGEFGFDVNVVFKPNISGLTGSNLQLYTYNSGLGEFTRLENHNARVDKNGFVHFTTTRGGVVVIANGELKK